MESLGGERSVYSCSDELLDSKRKELEDTFWVALQILEERRRNLLNRMAEEERSKGWAKS